MGRICHAKGCSSKSKRKEPNVIFHKIPSDPDIRDKWITICRVPSKFHSFKELHICSKHFKRSSYCKLGTKTVLKKNSVPSVFPLKYSCFEKYKLTKIVNQISDEGDGPSTTVIENQKAVDQINAMDSLDEDKIDMDTSKPNESIKEEYEIPGFSHIIPEIKTELIDVDNLNQEIDATKVKIEPATDSSSEEEQEKKYVNKEERIIELLKAAHVKIELPLYEYTVGQLVELSYFDDVWYNGVILQIDNDDSEILVEFEKQSKFYKEWIRMDSNRLRKYGDSSNELRKENSHHKCEEISIKKRKSKKTERPKQKVQIEEKPIDYEDSYTVVEIPILIGQKVELSDFNNWHVAVIVEIDNIENELLLQYETNSKKHVEWVPMNSKRIRVSNDSQIIC